MTDSLKFAAKNLAAGNAGEAIRTCRQLLSQYPQEPSIFYGLAIALAQSSKLDEAAGAYREAIRLNPDFYEAHFNLGSVLAALGRFDEATGEFSEAARIRPNQPEIFVNLSNIYRDTWKISEAVAAAEKSLAINPSLPEAHLCLGAALACRGEFDRAISVYRDAIRIRPNYPAAHLNLALALLVTGNFAEGWPEYEWRQRCPGVLPPRRFPQPTWGGQNPAGKTILLYPEQGLGDAIHFIRYAPLIAKLGAKVMVECPAPLVRLFGNISGIDRIIPAGEPLPPFDFHCALPSLPQAFKTTLDTIPAEVPYLTADPEAAKSCKHRVVRSGNLILAGLVWSGNAANRNDRNRSIPLSKFEPLAATNRFQFHSLQIAAPPANTGIAVIDHSAELKDFADTAALIANLDLVISVDTAVAHLAAAMGKKVWLLLPFPPDWRWLLDRADSPWYPTVRLFRQTTPGEWESVIGELARAEV